MSEKLLLIIALLLAALLLFRVIEVITLAVLVYEVKPLISKVDAKLDSLEMPDFSSVNELVSKADPLLELANELTNPMTMYYLKEFKNFMVRLDGIQGADIILEALPYVADYYMNNSVGGGWVGSLYGG